LEVGVSKGLTFNNLDFEYKVGVDPKFAFDINEYISESVRLIPLTSDDYFTQIKEKTLFDIIFLDGLHTWDQTLRDFNNAINCSNKSSIIIMDDVFPNDVFSALRVMSDCYKYRKANNADSTDFSWHGDVYKTVLFIHDFYPQISYVTIDRGYGNPQTFFYKKPRLDFKPFFESINVIEGLSYFDFLEVSHLLNLKTEKDALNDISAYLSETI